MNSEMPANTSLPTMAISADAPSFKQVQERDGGGREVDVALHDPGLVQHITEPEFERLQPREPAVQLFAW